MKILLKIKSYLFYLVFIFILTNCHKPIEYSDQTEYGLFTKNILVNNVSRRYKIYIPKNISKVQVPLVFELHGGGIYIEDMTGESGYKSPYKLWMNLAEKEKFIVVYPEGLDGKYSKPTWNDCRKDCIVNSNTDDVHFIDTLITIISLHHKVDLTRIYVSGTSNGGFMALRLAIELSNKIAAVAAIASAMPALSKCTEPKNFISILFMNGTNDNHMPYNGGTISNPPNPKHGTALSTKASVKYWINLNKTDSIPSRFILPDLDSNDGSKVEKFIYKNGLNNTEVILYKINGGGHSAPSIKEQYSPLFEKYFNKQNHDIEMTTEVWNFFRNKTI